MRLAMFLVLALGACSNNRATSQAETMADAVCACKDAECARKGLDDFRAWFEKHMPQGTRDDAQTVSQHYSRAEACATKFAGDQK